MKTSFWWAIDRKLVKSCSKTVFSTSGIQFYVTVCLCRTTVADWSLWWGEINLRQQELRCGLNKLLLYEGSISGSSHTLSGCNPCFHPLCLMVSLCPSPQARSPGVSPPRLSGTFTHLPSSHKVKDCNSAPSQSDLEQVCVAPSHRQSICWREHHAWIINSSRPSIHLQHHKLCCKNSSWNSHKQSEESSVNLFFCVQMALGNESDMQQQQRPGGNQWGYPPLTLCQTMKPTAFSPVVQQARAFPHKIRTNQFKRAVSVTFKR